jgi:hypothetical protein
LDYSSIARRMDFMTLAIIHFYILYNNGTNFL